MYGIPASRRLCLLALTGLLALAGCNTLPQPGSAESPDTTLSAQGAADVILPEKSLLITDVSVVEDPVRTTYAPFDPAKPKSPAGVWSFGRLMENLAGNQDPSAFTLNWLRSWETDQVVNGMTIPARPAIRTLLIDPWLVASGCAPGATECRLDFAKAPFRLGSINTRLDLRDTDETGKAKNGGEGRFIFFAVNPDTGAARNVTFIFEFRQPARDDKALKDLARKWRDLSGVAFGEPFNARLQALTDAFAGRNADPARQNGSALNQLRTNDVSFAAVNSDPSNLPSTKLWEMREFFLAADGHLRLRPVAQTPRLDLNGTPELGAWVQANAAAILAGEHQVPVEWLDASSPTPFNLAWNAPGADEATRKAFGTATCSGCHLSETGTAFTHVKPRAVGAPSALSAFLTQQALPERVQDLSGIVNADKPPRPTKKARVH